ncbi:serum response factor-binding protein 1 [Ceratina calcarata]|uniref:Serum response factor-binding protein 1 n=1 Tax=Ceratina calcarata TaxID=156304 RepID=A0AAJ7JER7_9HYME|nr:serum response factor-binding protein 1 [Ceratina calcarata]
MIKTRKTEINNEFVSLRQFVRQARIRVVNKLTREAKKLRASHGDEKQTKRNKSKAEKLLREVFALKQIKDDEISKFGIVRFNDLQAILQNSLSDDGTRAMIKIIRYKSLNPRIAALREKFPDCEDYITLDKKGPVNKKRNGTTDSSKKSSKQSSVGDTVEKVQKQIVKDVGRVVDTDDDDDVQESSQKKNKVNGTADGETKQNTRNSAKRLKVPETGTECTNSDTGTLAKIVSREATVKRFTEILKETEEHEGGRETLEEQNKFRTTEEEDGHDESVNQLSNEAEEADDFFLNSNKTVPRSDPEKKYTDGTHDVSYNKPMSKRKKFYDGKESYSVRWNNERSKGVHRGRNNTQEANSTRKRKITPNEERDSGKSTNENLHPSWAAKKKQQDILKQGFQGKKIKFDEDQ